ncbi:MAG: hypothetical protein VX589_14140 [Myxococcota bacterium]|nr:hypothetical protein [Myxococcota bacterium]
MKWFFLVIVTLIGCTPGAPSNSELPREMSGQNVSSEAGAETREQGGGTPEAAGGTRGQGGGNSDDAPQDQPAMQSVENSRERNDDAQSSAPIEDGPTPSDAANSFFNAPTVEALTALADEHEATEEELKIAGLFWAFVIAAQAGEPISPIFLYPEFQAEVRALGLSYPSLNAPNDSALGSARQPLIRRGEPFECREGCLPDPADFLSAAGEGILDLAITNGLSQLKTATRTLAKTVNRAQRFTAATNAANVGSALGAVASAADRARGVAQAKMALAVSDALDIAGGVIAGLGLVGVQSAKLTGAGMVVTAFGAGVKIGDAAYQTQRLVEDCLRFQNEACQCGNEQLDPGELCDYSVADSCLNGDEAQCEPAEGPCMAPRIVGDPRSCDETCEPTPIDYCENDDGCCPEGCAIDTGNVPYSLRDNDCASMCGNGVIDPGEQCDGADFGNRRCDTEGNFDGGELSCTDDCQTIQTSNCSRCGNGVRESGEVCDFGSLNGESCESRGAGAGELRCDLASQCQRFDLSRCEPSCGNGILDDGEVCDLGVIPGDASCEAMGLGEGVVRCDLTNDCRSLDTSECMQLERLATCRELSLCRRSAPPDVNRFRYQEQCTERATDEALRREEEFEQCFEENGCDSFYFRAFIYNDSRDCTDPRIESWLSAAVRCVNEHCARENSHCERTFVCVPAAQD